MNYSVEELNILSAYDVTDKENLKNNLVTDLCKMPKNWTSGVREVIDYETAYLMLFGSLIEKIESKTYEEYQEDLNDFILPFFKIKKDLEGASYNE